MGKYKPTLEEVYNSYVQEVIERNQSAIEQDKAISEEYKDMSVSELKAVIKELGIKEDKYKNKKGKKTGYSRYADFEKNEKSNAMKSCYFDKPEVREIIKKRTTDIESIQARTDISEETKIYRKGVINQMANLKLEIMFDSLPLNQQEDTLKEFYIQCITQIKGGRDTRQVVQKELGKDIKFDGNRDKGNCTKAITVSLYNLQKKFGLNIFPDLDDIEKIAHPKDLIEYLKPYVKEAPSGEIKDIPDIKVGDIFIFKNSDNEPKHAMMCHNFNEYNEPLVLGFSNNTRDYNGARGISYAGEIHPRKGCIIDTWSLIRDAYHQKYNVKTNTIQSHQIER